MLIRPRRDEDLLAFADLVQVVHRTDGYPRFPQYVYLGPAAGCKAGPPRPGKAGTGQDTPVAIRRLNGGRAGGPAGRARPRAR